MKFPIKLARTGVVTVATAIAGSTATEPNSLWYKMQSKPSWQPPAWAFPVAWTALYGAITASSAKVIVELDEREADADDLGQREDAILERRSFKKALGFNLVLNAGWPAMFWQVRNNKLSAIEAGALALSSADLARRAFRVSRGAGIALIPYVAWTTFATALTTSIARRN